MELSDALAEELLWELDRSAAVATARSGWAADQRQQVLAMGEGWGPGATMDLAAATAYDQAVREAVLEPMGLTSGNGRAAATQCGSVRPAEKLVEVQESVEGSVEDGAPAQLRWGDPSNAGLSDEISRQFERDARRYGP